MRRGEGWKPCFDFDFDLLVYWKFTYRHTMEFFKNVHGGWGGGRLLKISVLVTSAPESKFSVMVKSARWHVEM